jgi:DNA-binding response OmpR family regulator
MKNLNVLFVEDEQNIRQSLKKAIGDEFKKFITAVNGEDGLKKFKNEKFDLVISDISMPKLNGLEMVKEIKKINPAIHVILLSAYSDREKLLQAIDIGVSKYMIKPIDPDELIDNIILITKDKKNIIKIKDQYLFNLDNNTLYKDDTEIIFTKKELQFVAFLSHKNGALVSKESIKLEIWNNKKIDDTLVRALVKRIRLKTNKSFIITIVGLGYKINL